jgi:hypothetical protein
MKIKHIICSMSILSLLFMAAGSAHAGAWTQKKGSGYHRVAANYYFADENFDSNGDSHSMEKNGEFKDINLNYYGEYGLLDSLTVFGSFYYKDLEREDDEIIHETKGIGDVDLGLRYNLYSGKIGVLSMQGMVKIPELYDDEDSMPLGNGQYDYEARLLYGRSLWPVIPGYMNLEAGYRWRSDEPSDEFRYIVEAGSDLWKGFYTRAKLDGLVSMDNADNKKDALGNPTSTLEYDLLKLDMTLGYKISSAIGLELGYTPAISGENTAKGTTWTIAISYKHGK